MSMQQATAALAIRDREALRSRLRAAGGELDHDGWLLGDEGHDRAPGERRQAAVLLGLVGAPGRAADHPDPAHRTSA